MAEKFYHEWQFVNISARKKWFCTKCEGFTDAAHKGAAAKRTCPGKKVK